MAIKRSRRPIAGDRIAATARRLLDASQLCAIATVDRRGRAYINTAYFAWTPAFALVWLSEPRAKHSTNIRANESVAIAVYDSRQTWGKRDRGIQVFGSAARVRGSGAGEFERAYAERFPDYAPADMPAFRLYVLHAERLKLFDETDLGPGVFVTARIGRDRRPVWERTDVYAAAG
jgi:uncharacterized protein YhbP (UPF0306 family)